MSPRVLDLPSFDERPVPALPSGPRLLRRTAAAVHLGISTAQFDRYVRPELHEIAIGGRGTYFDRVDLDHFVESRKKRTALDEVRRLDTLAKIVGGA